LSNTIDYIAFNCKQPPFDDVRVRTAIALAVNESAIVKMVPGSEPIPGIVPATNWGHNPEVPETFYDVERAKELLKEAGYPDGLEITIKARSTHPHEVMVAEIVQNMLSQIGVKVNIETIESATLLGQMRGGEKWQMATLHWGGAGKLDPDGNMRVLCHPEGDANWITNYENPAVTVLLDVGVTLTDMEARRRIYQAADKLIFNDHPMIWWGRKVQYAVAKPYVHGLRIRPTGYFPVWDEVWMEQD